MYADNLVGQYIACRVMSINKPEFSVTLASANSKLNDTRRTGHYAKLDPYLLEREAEQMDVLPDPNAIQRKKAAAGNCSALS